MIPRPQISTLFPYPPLFRSRLVSDHPPPAAPALAAVEAAVRVEHQPVAFVRILTVDHGLARRRIEPEDAAGWEDRKSRRLNSSHANISYAVFCLKKKKSK